MAVTPSPDSLWWRYTPSYVHPFSSPTPSPAASAGAYGWNYTPPYIHPFSSPQAPVGPTAPSIYHTYTPQRGGWKLPAGTYLGYEPGKGYYAKHGTPPKPPGPVKGSPEWILQQLYGSLETPAQAEARAKREAQEWYDLQRKALQEDYDRQAARAQQQAAAAAAWGQAAAGMSGDLFAAVGGEYNRAAREIQGLSHGLTGGAADATQADVDAANEGLARVGPGRVTEGGASGIAGPGQAGVEDYLGGTLPGQLLRSAGEAETFGLAGLTSAQNLAATQNAQAQLMTAMQSIGDNETKAVAALAAGQAEMAHKYLTEAQDARIKTISLIQGITAQQSAGTTTKPITRTVGGDLVQWDPTNPKAVNGWVTVKKGNSGAAAAAKLDQPNSALSKVYGYIVNGRGEMIPGPDGKKQPVAQTPEQAKVNIQLSRALGRWVDANGISIPGMNGAGKPKPPPFFKPGQSKGGKGPKPPTTETKQQGWDEVKDYKAIQDKWKAYNAKLVAAGKKEMPFDVLATVGDKILDAMGFTTAQKELARDSLSMQELYIDLVHSGIPAKMAWMMIRKYYPNFGQGYFT